MNTYKCSNGDRLRKSVVDSLIRKAKGEKVRQQFEEQGYNSCESCGISNGTYLDVSHTESVKSCQENGRTEKAFDIENLRVLCRKCHQKHDKLDLRWKG